MSEEHTPGPWTLREGFSADHGQFSIDGPDKHEIAAVEAWVFDDRPEALANARLIAAAPAMLEALKRAEAIIMAAAARMGRLNQIESAQALEAEAADLRAALSASIGEKS